MTYTSFGFFVLVAVLLLLYYILPEKVRWLVLLAGNAVFYYFAAASRWNLLVFATTVVLSYLAGLLIEKVYQSEKKEIRKKTALWTGIILSILPFLGYKLGVTANSRALVTLGISFYSLQIIAYLVDISRGRISAERNLLRYGLFMSFFPQIIQGPIPRYGELAEQLYKGHKFKYENLTFGAQLTIWGLFLKFMIADTAGVVVDQIFNNYEAYEGFYVLVGGVLYSLQLYTDFMACVSISQGVSQMFGISLSENFNRPYFATSIKDFWRRWHMSLSSWLRDYVYIPLGGNRGGKARKYLNILLTFAVSGFWHGNGIKFLFWGLLHGLYQIVGELTSGIRLKIADVLKVDVNSGVHRVFRSLVTFFFVMIGWIIFRAEDFRAAIHMLLSIPFWNPWVLFDDSFLALGLNQKQWNVLIISLMTLLLVGLAKEKGVRIRQWIAKQHVFFRWTVYITVIWVIWVFGTYGFGFNANDFIYGGF